MRVVKAGACGAAIQQRHGMKDATLMGIVVVWTGKMKNKARGGGV